MATDHNFRIKNGLEVGGQLIVNSSGQLVVANVTSNLKFNDNVKALFGDSGDVEFYFDGNSTILRNTASSTGNPIYIQGGAGTGAPIYLQAINGTNGVRVETSGKVALYHGSTERLATTSSGVDVTGTAVVDTAFTLENIATLNQSSNNLYIKTITNGTGIVLESRTGYVTIRPTSGVTNAQFRPNGDNYLGYESTGANAKLFWDASAESLGIGTTSPVKNLHVAGDARISDGNGLIDFNPGYIPINATHSSGYAHIQINGMQFGGGSTSTSEGYMKPADNSRKLAVDSNGFRFYIGGIASSDELIRFDSTGKVGIGTTSPAQLLTVEGGAEAIGLNLTGSGSRLTIGSDGTYNYFRAKSGNQFKFTTTGGSDLHLNNAGVLTLSAGTSNRTVQLQDDGLYISRTSDGAYTSKVISDSANTNNLSLYARSYINFYHDSTKRFSFRETGALGINEASPNYTIHATKDMASSPSNIIYLEMAGTNADGGGGAIRFDTSASSTTETAYWAGIEGIRSGTSDGSNELKFYTASAATNSGTPSVKMTIDRDGNTGIGITGPSARLHVQGTTTDNSADAFRASDSSGTSLLRVRNDGVILIEDNYLYVTSNAGAYFDNSIKARGGIHNDQGTLLLNDDVNVTGQLQVYNGSSTNRIRLYTETGTAQIADTLSDTTTQKSYIYFDAGSGSNDPGYIMHETSDSEQNEGILHLVPSDDNDASDYVSIHGTNDADCLRLRTNGKIDTAGGYQLVLLSGNGDVLVDDGLTVSNNLTVTGDLVVNGSTTTFNTATLDVEDKNITLNYGSGDTSATAGGAGITIQDAVNSTTDATILWDATNDEFDFSHAINITGNITVSGTVDGRDIATDGSKLDNIEANATADQTAADIRSLGFFDTSNDGSGSGLDADLLDNQHGSYYLDANNLTGTINNNRLASSVVITDGGTYATGFGGDLNTITGWRIHRVTGYSGSTDNRAFTSHHNLFTMPNTSSAGPYSVQIAAETDSSPDMKFRASYGSTSSWSSWNKIWTDNNDGSGSGLDADLLDGQQGSYYLNYNNLTNTPTSLPANGGNADTVDSLHAASFLRSDADDTASGIYTFSRTSTTPVFNITGHAGASQYNYFLRAGNDTYSTAAVHFVNGSTRSGDHGANAYVIRNDNGTFVLGKTSQSTKIYGSGDLTYNDNEVWHAGNDGTGSGLDADLLDGVHGASFLRSDTTDTATGTLTLSNNNNQYSGHHYFIAYDSNGNHYPHYNSGSGNNGAQINLRVQQSGGSGFDVLYIANGTNDIQWRGNKLWNAANDGSGSGLDADTVDGINGASFLRSDTADTATGNIDFARASFGSASLHTTGGTHGVVTDSFSLHSGASDLMYMRPSALRSDNGFFQWQTYNGGNGGDIELQPYGGSITISTGSVGTSSANGLRFQTGSGSYSDGRWQHRFRKQDKGGGIPLYIDISQATANSFTELARFGTYSGNNYEFEVQGDINATGNLYDGGNAVWHTGNDGSGSGLDADTLDGVQGSSFLRSDTTDTASGVITFSDRVNLHEIRSNTGQEVIINAGESASYATGQTGEYLYVNADNGLQVNVSPDNWSSGWAGRKTLTYDGTNGLVTSGGFSVDTSGNLSATTKSFDIEHPTKEGMRLRYGVLEGPENGVYIRGRTKGSLIQLPEYWTGLVHEDTITVQLTPIGKSSELYVKDIADNKVLVSNDTEYFYYIMAERKDVERFEVEYDNSV